MLVWKWLKNKMTGNKPKINQTIIWLGLLNLLLVGGIFVLAYLSFSRISNLGVYKNNLDATTGNFQELKNIALSVKNNQSLFDNYFVDSSTVFVLVKAIEEAGKKSGAELKIGQADEQKKTINLKINITGDFLAVFKALKLLENLPFLFSFNKVAFQKNSNLVINKDSKILAWSADLDLAVPSGK